MKCPACSSEMIVLGLCDVEIDYCEACGGIWLDAGELETFLAESAAKVMADFRVLKHTDEPKIKCPACRKKMKKEICGSTVVDICERGHGIWFDRGELAEIIAYDDMNSEVLELLKKMFCDTIKQEGE